MSAANAPALLVLCASFSPALAFTQQVVIQPSVRRYQTMLDASSTSLASSFSIRASSSPWREQNNFVWELIPLPTTKEGNGAGVGTIALEALESQPDSSTEAAYTLNCNLCASASEDDVVQMKVSTKSNNGKVDDEHIFLLGILARIFIQWTAALSPELSTEGSDTKRIDVSLHLPGPPTSGCDLSLVANDLLGNEPIALFHGVIDDVSSLEMSEMVNSMGDKLGAVPRPLVHKLNLLHRGIGMIVCKGEHITRDMPDETLPEIYCHQRTDSKRVFASLYDMFVGGVSTAGEDARLTASREVAEELGLARALDDPRGDALAGPLFQCTVCTSYNRCVVSMFTYKCMDHEIIKWQEEEVQWGDWVSYRDVESSAILSINRLKERGDWPGSGKDTDNELIVIDQASGFEGETWCYVPDGLLVWEAWARWREENQA